MKLICKDLFLGIGNNLQANSNSSQHSCKMLKV